jgi:Sigma-70, region 4/Cation transporter/ATPase, N-terminus
VEPEDEALLADSIGLALLVVLDALPPAERLAFVLHDMFAVPFDEIGPMVRRSPAAARQLASRARRRIQEAPTPDRDPSRQRAVVDACFAAARACDFDTLVAVLDPEIVLRSDHGTLPGSAVLRGPKAIAAQALRFADPSRIIHPALVNGAAGVVITLDGKPVSIVSFTVANDRIIAIDALADPERIDAGAGQHPVRPQLRPGRRAAGSVGRNVLASHKVTALGVLGRQLRNPLLILLLAVAGVSAATGDPTDGAIIAAIVALSVGLGFINEYRSGRREMAPSAATDPT